ncbi:Ig-like domain-containing protein [Massilia sp. MS-15]|uniref:Ig-like domain-containing protein n=1 Tax=Massilia sp. MS-15 TaxID=2878200 RepID=UPI001CD4B89A|nr:Ig-like domain-containing protein [Massilia sp. MS-15]MCA1247429.1 Ig-like domain-containing protein [Massilia sp. MS-15]
MHHTAKQEVLATLGRWTAIGLVAASLAACGGGGGNPGTTVGGGGSGSGGGGTGGGGTGGGTPVTLEPKLTLALVDGSGATVTSLSGGQSASVKATVLDAAGKPAANAIVQFAASASSLVVFTPETGSALTDANGVAVVSVKPASVSSAGATAITATSVIGGKTATASSNIAVGAAPLTLGTLSFSPAPSGTLPAFSTVSLSIPVTSGGQPAASISGLSMNSLCVGDGTATLVPGSFANGIQTATYTNNGCLRGRDTISVAIGNSTQTISLDVGAANIGAIQFSGSSVSGSSIVLKGSGGQGRTEAAQITFRVVDQHGNGLAGVDVNFGATTYTGGLTVSPTRATTDSTGSVSTMVSSGTVPTPVRVIAEATRNGVKISGLSDTLTVSTGLPIQRFMSMSAEKFNIEGLDYDNETTDITVLLADQYGNPVSDNTAINFVTEGGAVGTSAQGACVTKGGACTVALRSQAFKPVNGRVTVLAYLQGVEDFTDSNGDGQYSCTGYSGSTPYRPLVDSCPSGGEPFVDQGDPFLDTGSHAVVFGQPARKDSLDGSYEAAKGDLPFPFNRSSYSAAGDSKWGLNYIRRSLEIVFSGSDTTMVRQVCSTDGCRDWTAADGDPAVVQGVAGSSCSPQTIAVRLFDRNNNPLPFNTRVTASDSTKISVSSFLPDTVASTNAIGGTIHYLTVKPNTTCESGTFMVRVETPKGKVTGFNFKSN